MQNGPSHDNTMSKHKRQLRTRTTITKKLTAANGYSFSGCYLELCRQQRIRPLPVICVNLPKTLDFTPDRVKMDEWGPILTSLSLDRTLKNIKIHSRYQKGRFNSEDQAPDSKSKKSPPVLTRYILERLAHSTAQCARNSTSLTRLELEGVPLTTDCVAVLCVGISGSKCLQHLSLSRSYIGESGCELVSQMVVSNRNIRTLNLGYCDLNERCGSVLATALSRQKLSLYHDTWKQSLRYRQPDFEKMPGLRRLTLNGNPELGDVGVGHIVDAVRDSLWIKALDLQNCGLTSELGSDILDLVSRNGTLVVVDVRMNGKMDGRIIEEVVRKLERDQEGEEEEYKWLGVPRRRVSSVTTRTVERKKSIQDVVTSTTPSAVSRNTLATPLPVNAKKPQSVPLEKEPEKTPLHIDLHAQMLPKSNASVSTEPQSAPRGVSVTPTVPTPSFSPTPVTPLSSRSNVSIPDHHTLLDKIDTLDLQLQEETLRRKLAEEKLLSMKRSVLQLENALKQKELDLRGYVLVSQESLDEMCSSFDQLLELLNDLTLAQKPVPIASPQSPRSIDDFRKRMDSFLRRTKSEALRRRKEAATGASGSANKFVRSESNFRSTPVGLPVRLQESLDELRRRKLATPIERSRAIFTQLVNGDCGVNFREYEC